MSISRKSMPSLEAEALFREWWTLDTNTPSNLLHFQCPTVVITAEKVEVQDLKLMYNMWDSYTSLWTGTRLHSFLNKSTGTISVASSVGNLDGRWYSGSWHHSCMYMSWLQGYIYWWGEEYVSGCDYLVHCNMSDFSSTEIAYQCPHPPPQCLWECKDTIEPKCVKILSLSWTPLQQLGHIASEGHGTKAQ